MRKPVWLFGFFCVFSLAIFSGAGFCKEQDDSKNSAKKIAENYKRDKARDAKLAFKPNKETEYRERYTSKGQAEKEAKKGLSPKTHLGDKVIPGRLPTQEKAAKQYGIDKKNAKVRTVWRVDKGTPVKSAKVIGGAPGKGELTVGKRIPPENRRSMTTTQTKKGEK